MRWSITLWLAALLAMLNVVTGCAGPTWPRVHAHADSRFMSHHRGVRTIDILPADIQVWTGSNDRYPPDELAAQIDALVSGAVIAGLSRRGYQVAAQMGWDGIYVAPDGTLREAMPGEHLEMTAHALSGYGQAMAQAGASPTGGLLVPYLPHRLGTGTGADATLYIGGWSYVGEDPRETTGQKVLEGVAIGLLVVAIAVVIIIALDKAGGGGGGGGGVARAAGSAGRVAVTAGRAAGRAVTPLLRGVARAGVDITRGMLQAADAFGRMNTHIHIYAGRPNYYAEDRTPKRGRSRMQVEMTMVDNHTGLVLWHAQDAFPAHGTRAEDVNKVFELMLSSLPAQ